jgi:hypothetical protein
MDLEISKMNLEDLPEVSETDVPPCSRLSSKGRRGETMEGEGKRVRDRACLRGFMAWFYARNERVFG